MAPPTRPIVWTPALKELQVTSELIDDVSLLLKMLRKKRSQLFVHCYEENHLLQHVAEAQGKPPNQTGPIYTALEGRGISCRGGQQRIRETVQEQQLPDHLVRFPEAVEKLLRILPQAAEEANQTLEKHYPKDKKSV